MKGVVPYIDSKYNTINDRNGRYIGGSSMGGYIALYYGLRHSELFSKIGGHMPSVKIGSYIKANAEKYLLFYADK